MQITKLDLTVELDIQRKMDFHILKEFIDENSLKIVTSCKYDPNLISDVEYAKAKRMIDEKIITPIFR